MRIIKECTLGCDLSRTKIQFSGKMVALSAGCKMRTLARFTKIGCRGELWFPCGLFSASASTLNEWS